MTEQIGYDPNSEQAGNGERKGAEKDFSTQLQERLQALAERAGDTEYITGFATRFDGDDTSFEVHVQQRPSSGDQMIMFYYGGVHGSLDIRNGYVQDILSTTYGDPEAHLVDWQKMADSEDAPGAVRLIAGRVRKFVDDPSKVEPIDETGVKEVSNAVWDASREINAPVTYRFFESYKTPAGSVRVNGFSDMANEEGEYCSDEKKPGQFLSVSGKDFRYNRQVSEGQVSESFTEEIDEDNLPPLTDEQRKSHPYVVITAEQGMPHRDRDVDVSFDENGEPARVNYRTDGYTVIAANVSGAVTMMMQTWYDTKEEAQAWADKLYQLDLAYKRQDHTMDPERQKAVLDALDAALLTTELETA